HALPIWKFATEPTWIHDWPPERRIGAVMNPITGIPTSAAPTTFNASPSLNRNPRREDMALVLSVHRAGRGVSVMVGSPGTGRRWATSHAVTSATCSGDSGCPLTYPRQSGIPRSGRPTITVVRNPWSLTRARYDGSTTDPPLGPPRPSRP